MYFDPGTGSLIIQVLLAFLASIGAFLITFRTKITSFFKGKKEKVNNSEKK